MYFPEDTSPFHRVTHFSLYSPNNVADSDRQWSLSYEVANQDHSFMQGFEAAAHVVFGAPELTVWHPGLVNAPHPALGWDRWDVPSFVPPFSQVRSQNPGLRRDAKAA